jgi:hypothetical protein
MRIKNIDGLSADTLENEVKNGAKFIYFAYTVSLIVVTFRRTSGVYLLRIGDNAIIKGIPFTILSFLFGWWGIPFGPKYTFQSIRTNFKGGKDVTDEVMATIAGHKLFRETEAQRYTNLKTG